MLLNWQLMSYPQRKGGYLSQRLVEFYIDIRCRDLRFLWKFKYYLIAVSLKAVFSFYCLSKLLKQYLRKQSFG